jgi:hypothetical protein
MRRELAGYSIWAIEQPVLGNLVADLLGPPHQHDFTKTTRIDLGRVFIKICFINFR